MRQHRILWWLSAVLVLFGMSAQAQDVSQIKIGLQTANTSTTTANNYYPSDATTVSTREFWGPDPNANRPVELKELARALQNNVDLIYEYVHDNVRTVFMYGLQKGALGAMIDQSGTSFDQAHLMVELLRESGYSARYKLGTMLLSTTQANAWIGTNNTTALQKIFRDGGIPLNYSSGTFTIGHVWVEVTIPGSTCNTTCWFDPSYKAHTFKSTLANLSTLMGMGANEFATTEPTGFFMQAWSGMTSSPLVDPVWVSGVNHTNMQTKLQSYSTTLLTNLKSATYSGYEIDDVIGGQQINKTGSTPVRNNNSLPGFTTTVQRTWDCPDAIHCGVRDPYRTKLTVTMKDFFGTTHDVRISKSFFVDEIYGRRLYIDTPQNIHEPDSGGPGTFEPLCMQLTLDGAPVPATAAEPLVAYGCTFPPTKVIPLGRSYIIRLEVDHPYAASSGGYLDLTGINAVEKLTDLMTPAIIVHGWGDVSPALVSKLAGEQVLDRLLPVVDPDPGGGGYEPGEKKGDSAMDHTMTKLGVTYLAQYSRMAELQKRLGNSEHVLHHMIGVVYNEVDPQNGWAMNPNPPNTDNEWLIRDRAIGINIDGAISVNSKTNSTADRQKVIHSTLAAAALLEGSIFEQMLDSPFVGSTATRFQWGSANLAGMKFHLYRPNSPALPGGFGSDFPQLGCATGQNTVNVLPDYVNATKNFWAIAAAEKCLGPGNLLGPPEGAGLQTPSMQRGPAVIAFKPDHSSVAHVVGISNLNSFTGIPFKGGGAGVAPSYAREFDATGAASLLKDKFDDRSRLHGIDLNTGDLTYSAPADLTLGEGGFPYELAFQRTFKAGGTASPGLPDGWAHNLDIRASFSGDGLAKMGMESAAGAAEAIAAIYAAQQIYSVAPTLNASTTPTNLQNHLKRWVLAPFVMQWWGTKLNYNVVTINAGHDARQFTRFADGAFYPPRNGVGTLTQTGNRVLHPDPNLSGAFDRWDYGPVSFTYQSPEKDTQTFGFYQVETPYDVHQLYTEHSTGRKHGWHLTSWAFPFGVTLTYAYTSATVLGPYVDRLATVSNNLGRTLTLNYVESPDFDAQLLSTLTDGQGRTVTYSQPATNWQTRVLTQATSPENANGAEITEYEYIGDGQNTGSIPAGARPQLTPKLWKMFAPSDATFAKMQVDYDRTWRAKEYRDAVSVKTPAQRLPYSYFVTGSTRGRRVDPLGNGYMVYYDERARAIRFIDEEDRIVTQIFDNHDRVAERTYPEGNRLQFLYDDLTQQVKQITQLRKSSTYWSGSEANIVVSATYDPTCRKIKTVTDAKGKITTWNYNTTSCTLTSVQQPQVPNPEAGGALATPTTQYLYNTLGQMTQISDPTGRIVTFDYDPTTNYRLRRHVNPAGLNLTTLYGHNAFGEINSVTDPRGNVTSYTFDKLRRLKQVNAPLSATTINRLDLDGDVYQVERTMNVAQTQWQIWQKTFTPTKKVFQETSPTSEVTTYIYDGADRIDVVTDPDGRKTRTEYFRDGKTKKITKAHQSGSMTPIVYATYTLTPNGQIDTVADGNGNLTNLNYDAFDRLHRTFYPDPASGTPCSPAIPHSAAAPSCGANQKYEELAYDANGNITTKRNRSGKTITFAFDDLNRETSRTVQANPAAHFARTLTTSYDLASRKWDATVVEAPLANQTISHRYDAAGRLDYVDDSHLGATNRVDYTYDATDNRTVMTWPGGGSVTYTYDALNRMDTVTEGGITLADYDWDTLSRRDLVKLNNNGFNADLGYENDDDLNSLIHSSPGAVTFTIGRNHSSQVTSLSVSDGGYLSRPASTISDAYATNRLNQYSTIAGVAQAYDLNGNLTSDGTYTFEYDEENRLRSAIGGGTTATYEYDPLGRRRAKVVEGVTTKFVSDGLEEIEERDGSNNVLRKYAYGATIDDRIAMIDSVACAGGGRCYFRANWQGSTTSLINQNNTVNATYHYGPYGEGTNWTPTDALTGNPFRYTGRRVDPETGLYYYRARYYSPKLGRFLQTDPSGTKDDINLYAYVYADPINKTDPTGLSCTQKDGVYTCKVDYVPENATPQQLKDIATFEKRYTAAVNRLVSNPEKEATVNVPGYKAFTVTAGEVGQKLIDAQVRAEPEEAGGASTRGDVITLKAGILSRGDRTPQQLGAFQAMGIVHEGIHWTGWGPLPDGTRSKTGERSVFDPYKLGWEPLKSKHQDPYNKAAQDLLWP